MKSRMVILSMLVLGMLLSTAGAGLAVSGLHGQNNASIAQYGDDDADRRRRRPRRRGLGQGNVARRTQRRRPPAGGNAVQPARQVEAGATRPARSLPFTGFAAVPVLLGGIALLSAGLVLRRRTGDER